MPGLSVALVKVGVVGEPLSRPAVMVLLVAICTAYFEALTAGDQVSTMCCLPSVLAVSPATVATERSNDSVADEVWPTAL